MEKAQTPTAHPMEAPHGWRRPFTRMQCTAFYNQSALLQAGALVMRREVR